MRRSILLVLLALGAILGFGSGVHHLRWHRWAYRAAYERHVAELCVDAARTGRVPPPPAPGAWPGPPPTHDW